MNAGTTFVSPTTEFEITPPEFETAQPGELSLMEIQAGHAEEELSSEHAAVSFDVAREEGGTASPATAITPEEYRFLHEPPENAADSPNGEHPSSAPQQTEAEHTDSEPAEPRQDNEPRGLRRWFMRL